MFEKVLIANRGEIAVRIVQACKEMGVRTAAVYSDADRNAVHVRLADEARYVGPPAPRESYLNIERVVQAAVEAGADAVHPGYGFLSENAAFASAVGRAGLAFIGPKPEVIAKMGNKGAARRAMEAAAIPVVPGFHAEGRSTQELLAEAEKIGFPVMIKAVSGGGGKGMRLVTEPERFLDAAAAAEREALAAFGDGAVYVEKFIVDPRHVEVQVLGDEYGSVIHLFERECSIQRRHQKMVEETPSVALSDTLRMKMCVAALQAAEAVGYSSLGTVEFLLDPEGRFYFLEMNTRLQVEHAITEFVTGIDLVKTQIRVASGEPLPFEQHEVQQRGHAIECRVYAEDPEAGFLPSTGKLLAFEVPSAFNLRVDRGVQAGDEVTIHYDPMLAKVVAYARTRAAAIQKMLWGLENFVVHGVKTNIPFLRELLKMNAFEMGATYTNFIETYMPDWSIQFGAAPDEALIAAALFDGPGAEAAASAPSAGGGADASVPWRTLGRWRLSTP